MMRRHSRSESVGKCPDDDLENRHEKLTSKRSRKTTFITEYLIDFTSNSSLHGLRYIGEKERTFVEKIFWLFMFACSVVLCSGLIAKVYKKWDESPVIVSFAENSTPVWQIPYPAVTVCFETKAQQRKFNFTEYYHKYNNFTKNPDFYLTEKERQMFEDIAMVCDDHLAPVNGSKYRSGPVLIDTIREVSPQKDEVFYGCKWKDIPSQNCSDLFTSIVTEDGQCYTFNTLGVEDLFRTENLHKDYEYLNFNNVTKSWSLDNGYVENTPLETYPRRGLGFGAKAGLTFLLLAKEIDLDYLCKGPVQGFKILLHNPAELPRLAQQYFRSPLSQEVIVAVKPKMMTTSEGLRPYDPERRQCYFQNERYLRYYKVYTQANCEMECITNFTNARCGCVHFGMPHGQEMQVCSSGSMKCIKEAQMELVTIEIQSRLDSGNTVSDHAKDIAMKCKCLPACTSIEYEAETSQADYDWKALYRAFNVSIEEKDQDLHYARVMIFFKEAQFITSRRSELYGQTDFLANCGGLLGLFMGFSILSVAEIIYFLTLRLFCLLSKKRAAKRRISEPAVKETELPKNLKQAYVD